ncbi:hypothetical protein IAE35_01765 [Pseudomonas sp. S75]|uniref:polysaccharide lyase family 8 super-sandwich domain-containing protein n=1 Tax=unclassified Pseudomonas TaxID=196821 RepID=UPI001904C4EF|nr:MULTISPECIES: polysaccharide lyase family 8 super-sandwich domain-containing protein [unclassified Pseudomonas]MBJ9974018.1 hypothetical protein [Pseudomonas sp. S30]MBK0152052.1 hypothetical protein [Pseudomonas sp. S75]
MSISTQWVAEANQQNTRSPSQWAADAQTLAQALVKREATAESAATLELWKNNCLQGAFSDLQYPSKDAGDDIAPLHEHLERVRKLASAAIGKSGDAASAYAACAAQALAYYTAQQYTTRNWWHIQLGLALKVGGCLLLLAGTDQAGAIGGSLDYLQRTSNVDLGHTGANQMNFAYVQLLWAIAGWKAKHETQYLAHAYAASRAVAQCCEVVISSGPTEGEGIRVDSSYSQHNPVTSDKRVQSQLYAGTYGEVFLSEFFKFNEVLTGVFALTAESLVTIERHLTEGVGWFGYAGRYDFHVMGRAVSRNAGGGTRVWSSWCKALMPTARNPALLGEMNDLATGKVLTTPGFRGTRAFWNNDFLAHIDNDFAVFCKTISTRTVGTETGNGENKKGYYMGGGSYSVHTHGKEYLGIAPVWHWQFIPGTTVERVPEFTYPQAQWGYGAEGSHDFSGVISDGQTGVATMILTRQRIQESRQTRIANAGILYCLGQAGDLTKTQRKVHTTVNQCWFNELAAVEYKGGNTHLRSGELTRSDIDQVVHDDVVYQFLKHSSVTVEMATCKGSWQAINDTLPDTEVSGEVFSLWINHVLGASNDYAYAIRKKGTAAAKPDVVCTDHAHYVDIKDAGVAAGAVFTTSTVIALAPVKITALAAMAFVAKYDTSTLTLTVGDPTQKLDQIEVQLDWKSSTYTHVIKLPTGDDHRGKSVTVAFTEKGVIG